MITTFSIDDADVDGLWRRVEAYMSNEVEFSSRDRL